MISRNTKLLVLASSLIVFGGLLLIWTGLKPTDQLPPTVQTTPLVENTPQAISSAIFGAEGEKILVTEVVDGDTIEIEGGIRVRLLGIDTPETKDPRRPVECFGKQAANETERLVSGKQVILEKDVTDADKYGRLLRYVFLPLQDGKLLFVNDYLIREGFATALNYPPDEKYNQQFLEAQMEAKNEGRGLWGRC